MEYKEIFEREHWIKILNNVVEELQSVLSRNIKAKLKSELISEMTEKLAQEYFSEIYPENVKCASCDNDPDLIFGTTPVEIKVAKSYNGVCWRGGKYSKRESDYVLITWDFNKYKPEVINFAVYKAFLAKNDWIEQHRDNYYATLYTLNELSKNNTHFAIIGDITYNRNDNAKPVFEEI